MLHVANTDVIFRDSDLLWCRRKPPEKCIKKEFWF